jgi:hypothetical protein
MQPKSFEVDVGLLFQLHQTQPVARAIGVLALVCVGQVSGVSRNDVGVSVSIGWTL